MRITPKQINRLVSLIFKELKEANIIEFKTKEEAAFKRALEIVNSDFEREKELDEEVNKMMDDLERQQGADFQRYKMFPLLKKRLAEQKGIVL